MTPKEKAEELVDKYWSEISGYQDSKQCALIAVDEILKEYKVQLYQLMLMSIIEYWQQVKNEIELL